MSSGALTPAQVWTLANYVLTPREARRLFGFVGAGGYRPALRPVVSSRAPLARRFGAESLLVVMALCLLAATAVVAKLWRSRPASLRPAPRGPRPTEGVGLRASLRMVLDLSALGRAISVYRGAVLVRHRGGQLAVPARSRSRRS